MDCLPASVGHHHLEKFHPIKFIGGKFQKQLLSKSLVLHFNAGDYILRKKEPRTQAHFLLSGAVEIRDSYFSRSRLESSDDRARFCLENEVSEQATAIAKSKVSMLVFNQDYIDYILARSEEEQNKVVSIGTVQAAQEVQVDEVEEGDWMWRLINSPLFAKVPPSNMQEMFTAFKDQPVKAGQTVIRKGDVGDFFYVIKKGRVKIHLDEQNPGDTIVRAAGDYFGEDALMADTVRSASVTMLTDGVLAKLDNDAFKTLLKDAIIEVIDQKKAMELVAKQDPNYELIDVRIAAEYRLHHQTGSKNIPLNHLRERLPKMDQNKVYMLTEEGGRRSELAAHWMYQSGLTAYLVRSAQGM